MRNALSLVTLVSLSVAFAACSDDEASNEANEPVAIAESDAGPTKDPMVSPLATTIAPPPPPPADAPIEDAGAPAPAPSASIDPDAGPKEDAGADAAVPIIVVVPVLFYGAIHVTETTGATCAFSVDGAAKGTSTALDLELPIGTHDVKCHAADGREVTQSITVETNKLTNVALTLPAPGKLVAVAVYGTCSFYVNGAPKGTTANLSLELPAGTYEVACYPVGGGTVKSRSVILKPGETAMAMFKLGDGGAP